MNIFSLSRPQSSFVFFLRHRLIEIFGVALLGCALFLLISLLSYTSLDPSWNTAVDVIPQNWGGKWGAWTSDIFFQFFGWSAFLFCILCLWLSISCFCKEKPSYLFLRISLFFLGVLLLSLAFSESASLRGGALGALLYKIFPLPPPSFLLSLLWGGSACVLFFFVLGGKLQHIFLFLSLFYERLERNDSSPSSEKSKRRSLSRKPAPEEEKIDPLFEPKIPLEGRPIPQGDAFLRDYGPVVEKKISFTFPSFSRKKQVAEKEPLFLDAPGEYHLPPLDLLSPPQKMNPNHVISASYLQENAKALETVLEDFGIFGKIIQAHPGPVVTLYELQPAAGLKSSRVISLADDIARSMSAVSARVAVIPGRNVIGIELPNKWRETVHLQELFACSDYENSPAHLALALGKDIGGKSVIVDLARMPHLLVAGTTGSGKSVGINVMILSLIYRLPPERCKFIMIDPKMLELSVYDGIPHLLAPVVTDPKKAVVALKWVVREMENRYRSMAQLGVRNVEGYNKRLAEAYENKENLNRRVQIGFDEEGHPLFEDQNLNLTPLPFIVVVVDEMADLMLVAGKDIELAVQRLAQMARAAGIHLIMATQRPSVDVITGTIKANFPTRMSFQVTSKIDSRTILGEQGAEQLLGQGDMLYMASGGRITRVHGPFVSDSDVEKVVQFLKKQSRPTYIEDITIDIEESGGGLLDSGGEETDTLYAQAVEIVRRDQKASTSYIQRHLQIGYNRAARLVERMEAEGIVSAANHVGKREILSA